MVAGADCLSRTHVRFGSKADIAACPSHVRFTPESGHRLALLGQTKHLPAIRFYTLSPKRDPLRFSKAN